MYSITDYKKLKKLSINFNILGEKYKYSSKFKWLGHTIIKIPNDLVIFQEIIFKIKPTFIIETGIAQGGSLIFLASMLKLMNIKNSKVIGIDINLKNKNLKKIKSDSLSNKIKIFKGSSIDPKIVGNIKRITKNYKTLVILDSNHTEEHVLEELKLYSDIVSKNSYIIVQDTGISHMPEKFNINRPWSKKKNPHTAVKKFLELNKNFKINEYWYKKIIFSSSPDGFLKKIK
jgi:cephalosporin hydroxylase